jgi:site-specific DNA-methyltransferase (adenine-specific)
MSDTGNGTHEDDTDAVKTPYWSSGTATLYEGDCLQVLAELPEGSVDLIFADPPYNLSNDGITCQSGRMVSVNKGDWDKSKGVENDHEFNLLWLSACRRVLKPDGTIWVSGTRHVIFSVGYAMQQVGYRLLNEIAWYKPNAAPHLACRMFAHSHETLIWAAKSEKSKHIFNYQDMKRENGGKQMRSVWFDVEAEPAGLAEPHDASQSVWVINTPPKEEKKYGKHPTQKPLTLLRRVILSSSNPNDLVLDPFTGSSTTGVAALELGRRFVGIELDGKYLDLSRQRLGATIARLEDERDLPQQYDFLGEPVADWVRKV